MPAGISPCRLNLDYGNLTVYLLWLEFDVSGCVPAHDDSTCDVHEKSEDKISDQTITKYSYIPKIIWEVPWIFWSNTLKTHVRGYGPYNIENHEPQRQISKVNTCLFIMPESPHQFKALIQHADLSEN